MVVWLYRIAISTWTVFHPGRDSYQMRKQRDSAGTRSPSRTSTRTTDQSASGIGIWPLIASLVYANIAYFTHSRSLFCTLVGAATAHSQQQEEHLSCWIEQHKTRSSQPHWGTSIIPASANLEDAPICGISRKLLPSGHPLLTVGGPGASSLFPLGGYSLLSERRHTWCQGCTTALVTLHSPSNTDWQAQTHPMGTSLSQRR